VLRSIAELAAYGTLAALLIAASLGLQGGDAASSAQTVKDIVHTPAPIATRDRGALLFSAKGCVGCHTHAALPNARLQIGPDLTALPDRAATRATGLDAGAYVRQSLRQPQAFIVSGYTSIRMPDLHLTDEEIESLTAFLLSPVP
jgi:mono/diheme cytochrome c family protein